MKYRVGSIAEQRKLYLLAKDGDEEARNHLAESVMPFALMYANSAATGNKLSRDEVASCAGMGVVIALKTWHPGKGALTTYVRRPVGWQITDAVERKSLKKHTAIRFVQVGDGFHVRELQCRHRGPAAQVERDIERARLAEAVPKLPKRLATIIREHYFTGRTLKDIGVDFGISRERTRQLRNRALGRLRELLGETPE